MGRSLPTEAPSGPETTRPAEPADPQLEKELAVAQALLDEGQDEAALTHLQALRERWPDNARLLNKLGVCLARRRQLGEAMEAFTRATELDPAYAAPWSNMGNLHYEQGRWSEAARLYEKALQVDPEYAPAHNNLAAALKRLGRYGEAVAHLKQAGRLRREALTRPEAGGARGLGRWGFYLLLGLVALLYWLLRRGGAAAAVMLVATLVGGAAATAAAQTPAQTVEPSPEADPGMEGHPPGLDEFAAQVERFARGLLAEPITLQADGRTVRRVVPADLGVRPDMERILGELTQRQTGRPDPAGVFLYWSDPDPVAFSRLVQRLDRALARPPREPRVVVDDVEHRGQVVPAQPGRRVDRLALLEGIRRASRAVRLRVVEVPFTAVPARLAPEDLAGFAEPVALASFATRVDLMARDRTVNVDLAARELNGLVILPASTFSFNESVGPRITEAGYRQAPVVRNGELVIDVGGGVCQVSSTLYNTALLAGMGVRARAPHSLPVWYVPLGRDATVAWGLIDLRLENPYPHPVAVQAHREGEFLRVTLIGPAGSLPLPWRLRTTVEEVLVASVERVADPTLAAGVTRQAAPARSGYTATVWRELPLYGPLVARERVNRSTYAPRPGQLRVGSPPQSLAQQESLSIR